MGAVGCLGLTGGAQLIFMKQLKFDTTVWKTCLQPMEFSHLLENDFSFKFSVFEKK
jgi:hypothetical protein